MYQNNHFIDQAPSEPWKIPFYIVLALHIGIVLLIIYAPGFSKRTPKFENIYTIDLIEMAPQPQIAPQPAQPAEPDTVPPKAISVKTPKLLKPSPLAAPVSISPIKKKIKKKIKTAKKVATVDKKKAIEERKKLAESIREEARAQELAEQALRDLELERQLFAKTTSTATNTPKKKNKGTGSNRNSKAMNAVEAQWFAAVNSHLLRFWALPEFKQWDPELLAVIVITVDKNGHIINHFFESKSGDKIFDQFVTKTLQDASPLPKMPAALKKHRYELGLNFKPGTIQP